MRFFNVRTPVGIHRAVAEDADRFRSVIDQVIDEQGLDRSGNYELVYRCRRVDPALAADRISGGQTLYLVDMGDRE